VIELPWLTVPGPVFVIEKSGSGVRVMLGVLVIVAVRLAVAVAVEVTVTVAAGQSVTVVVATAVLFAVLLSGIVLLGFTVARLTNGERLVHGVLTSTMTVIVALLFGGRLPPEQAMTLPGVGAPQVNPLVPDAFSRVTPGGRTSVTATGTAGVPPAFPTVMV
jgi:hypothetical protein